MKTKKSTLLGLLAALLAIVTVLSSVLVFTAMADTEPEPESTPDQLVYASTKAELLEKNPLRPWTLNTKTYTWGETTNVGGDSAEYSWIFVDVTEMDYDLVAFGIGTKTDSNLLEYAFLDKLPTEVGEAASFVGPGYVKYSTGASGVKGKLGGKLWYDDIPEGTKYIGICATNWGTRVCPDRLIFDRTNKNLKDDTLAYYNYPMETVIPALMGVNDSGQYFLESSSSYPGGTNVAIIPVEGIAFDAVSFKAGKGQSGVDYAFVTQMPGNWDTIQTADGTNRMKTAGHGELVKIPDGAKYLFVRHTTKNAAVGPKAITFTNWAGVPSTIETKTVAYNLVENGCVYGWDNDHTWVETYSKDYHSGFVDLTDRNYTKVSFTVGSSNYLGYAFLNRTPIINEKVSYAGGVTSIIEVKDHKEGDVVTVAVPADATTIVVWMREGSTNYAPSSISLTYQEETEAPYGLELKVAAEARLNANSGLRFTTRIPTAELVGLGLNYTVGTLIFPTDALDGALTVETEGALKIEMTTGFTGNEYTYFSAAMTDIIAQNYARAFTAVSYIEVGGKYYYTAATSSSIYEAAVETHKANAEDPNADAVRAYIDGVVVIEGGKQVMPYDGYEHPLSATYVVNEPTATLTITGENLTEDSLKAVILDGKIYTGGWELVDGKLVATYSFLKDDRLSEYNYPMGTVTPAEGCITYYLKDVTDDESYDYKADPEAHKYVISDEYSDYRIAFINVEGTVFTKAKFTGNEAGYIAWFWLEEMPTLGEAISYAGNMDGIHETNRGSGSQTGEVGIQPGSKVLAVVYQRPTSDGTDVQKVLPEGILFVK